MRPKGDRETGWQVCRWRGFQPPGRKVPSGWLGGHLAGKYVLGESDEHQKGWLELTMKVWESGIGIWVPF